MRSVCLVFVLAAACKSKAPPSADKTTKPAAREEPAKPRSTNDERPAAKYANKGDEPIEQLSTADGDGAIAATVAEKYQHALATQDWSTACTQRLKAERDDLARMAGSCEAAFRAMMKGQPVEVLSTLYAYAARRRGKLIAVDMVQPGQKEPFVTLLLGRDGDQWFLVDLDEEQTF